jgi:tetratricopeptide (TPR) repeat protein
MRHKSKQFMVLIFGLLLLAASVSAQEVESASAAEQAAAHYQAEEWAKAARAYERVVEEEPANGQAWLRLGLSRYNLKKFSEATQALEQADKIGFAPQFGRYWIGVSYAQQGEKDRAFEWLNKAIEAGYANVQQLESADDLAPLRGDERFGGILLQAKTNLRPCENLEVYRQFDFWVGDWEVHSQGQKAGTNSIQKVAGDCILLENWTSASGISVGKSINFYHPHKKKWVQLWVDSSGLVLPIEGEYRDGAMHFRGEYLYRNGNRALFRGTWTPLPDGRVRQFLEQSTDEGKTWNVWFDGYYSRQTQASND